MPCYFTHSFWDHNWLTWILFMPNFNMLFSRVQSWKKNDSCSYEKLLIFPNWTRLDTLLMKFNGEKYSFCAGEHDCLISLWLMSLVEGEIHRLLVRSKVNSDVNYNIFTTNYWPVNNIRSIICKCILFACISAFCIIC